MKIVHFNETNRKILGYYDKEIHTVIPEPNLEISEEIWQNAIDNNHNFIGENGLTETRDLRTEEEKAEEERLKKLPTKDELEKTKIELIVMDLLTEGGLI